MLLFFNLCFRNDVISILGLIILPGEVFAPSTLHACVFRKAIDHRTRAHCFVEDLKCGNAGATQGSSLPRDKEVDKRVRKWEQAEWPRVRRLSGLRAGAAAHLSDAISQIKCEVRDFEKQAACGVMQACEPGRCHIKVKWQ